MKVYISGPLKVVSNREKFQQFYEFLADTVREFGHEPYLPHQKSDPVIHKDVPNRQVFLMDFNHLTKSDLILAVIDEPSTGVGAEIGIALDKGIEVIAIHNVQNEPSRFILGLFEERNSKIISYENQQDCRNQLEGILNTPDYEKLVEL